MAQLACRRVHVRVKTDLTGDRLRNRIDAPNSSVILDMFSNGQLSEEIELLWGIADQSLWVLSAHA
jgi:hypothetical protein